MRAEKAKAEFGILATHYHAIRVCSSNLDQHQSLFEINISPQARLTFGLTFTKIAVEIGTLGETMLSKMGTICCLAA